MLWCGGLLPSPGTSLVLGYRLLAILPVERAFQADRLILNDTVPHAADRVNL
ncbi:hypothetical protein [[Phormidium] sp. ETS-05]|uniref:hypothetical protein n=1 Tax=[Phormidium] sp. ETS-05 TaxID=222819 RepID=UPI0018EEE114|nr:hypothetical protein [[Phormidium] sp. ETS-05]